MNETFSIEFGVGACESDCFSRLRPSSLMRFIQEAAIGHVLELGIDRAWTLEHLDSVWMVIRTRVDLKRPIMYDETVTVKTWAAETKGAVFPRESEIFVGDESVGEVSATWVIANIDTGRMLRPKALFELAEFPDLGAPRFASVEKIQPIEPLGEPEIHRVRYSDMDMNRHVNNTRYTDFAADHIALETMPDKWIRSMTVSFSSQCVAGDDLVLASANDGDRWYVRGSSPEGRIHFEQEFILEDVK